MSTLRRWLPEAAAVVLLLLAFSARSLLLSQRHYVPVFDEVPYIDEAREHARLGGTLGIVRCYLRAECRYDNRNPLFSMVLAPWMEGGPADFPRAKLATLLSALALILAVYGFSRALWGRDVALAAAAVPALSPALALQSQQVMADPLFAFLYVCSLGALVLGERRPAGWAACGALAGLAYLAKGTGHLLLLAPAALALLRFGRRAPAKPRFWLAVAAFAAAASFVLVRNVRLHGTLFYNVNARGIWLDDWSQVWTSLSGPDGWASVGPLQYWRSHTLGQIAARLGAGFAGTFEQLREICGPGPAETRWFAGGVVLALAALGLRASWKEGRRAEPLTTLAVALPLFAAFCWGHQVGILGFRFHLSTAASLAPFAALGGRWLWRRGKGPALPSWAVPAGVAAAALLALVPARAGLTRDPMSLWAIPPHWTLTADWLEKNAGAGGYLLSQESFFSLWDRPAHDSRRIFAFERPAEDVLAFADAQKTDVLLLDTRAPSVGRFPGRFGPVDEHGPLSYLGWPRCFHDPVRPSQFLAYCRPKEKRRR